MRTLDVAHIRVAGTDLILVPVEASFESRPHAVQLAAAITLQRYATRAGLAGIVVPVWAGPGGRMTFFARPSLHHLIERMNLNFIAQHINYRLAVGMKPERASFAEPVGMIPTSATEQPVAV